MTRLIHERIEDHEPTKELMKYFLDSYKKLGIIEKDSDYINFDAF